MTPLPELFSGTTPLSPLASSDGIPDRSPRCQACGCGLLDVERSYRPRYRSCPQCRLLVLDYGKPRYSFCDYGWTVAFLSDLASHSLYQPPPERAAS